MEPTIYTHLDLLRRSRELLREHKRGLAEGNPDARIYGEPGYRIRIGSSGIVGLVVRAVVALDGNLMYQEASEAL